MSVNDNRVPAPAMAARSSPTPCHAPSGEQQSRSALRSPASTHHSDPPGPAEAHEQDRANSHYSENHSQITVAPVQLRHIFEVHAVEAGDGGRHSQNRGPSGELAADGALA